MEFNGCDFRQATSADGHELLRVQRRAIHTIDRAFYALRELESWATGLTPEGYGLCIAEGEEIEVAVDGSDRITGFSSRMDGAILGLFVDPSAQGRGLGAALLSRAEEGLIDGGARSSEIRASLSAVRFYERFGYAPVREVGAPTRGGLELRFAEMSKYRNA